MPRIITNETISDALAHRDDRMDYTPNKGFRMSYTPPNKGFFSVDAIIDSIKNKDKKYLGAQTKDKVREILKEVPNEDNLLLEYYMAILTDTLPKYYLDTFIRYKLSSDDLPKDENGLPLRVGEGCFHPMCPNVKCRGNDLIGNILQIQSFISDEVIKIPENLEFLIPFLNHKFRTNIINDHPWTTEEDIQIVNTTLDEVTHTISMIYEFSESEVNIMWEINRQKINDNMIKNIEGCFKKGNITEEDYRRLLTGEISWCMWKRERR